MEIVHSNPLPGAGSAGAGCSGPYGTTGPCPAGFAYPRGRRRYKFSGQPVPVGKEKEMKSPLGSFSQTLCTADAAETCPPGRNLSVPCTLQAGWIQIQPVLSPAFTRKEKHGSRQGVLSVPGLSQQRGTDCAARRTRWTESSHSDDSRGIGAEEFCHRRVKAGGAAQLWQSPLSQTPCLGSCWGSSWRGARRPALREGTGSVLAAGSGCSLESSSPRCQRESPSQQLQLQGKEAAACSVLATFDGSQSTLGARWKKQGQGSESTGRGSP